MKYQLLKSIKFQLKDNCKASFKVQLSNKIFQDGNFKINDVQMRLGSDFIRLYFVPFH